MNPTPSARPAVDVLELNPYAPRPFVFTEVALCLRDAIRAAGYPSEIRHGDPDPSALTLVLGALPPFTPQMNALDPRRTAIVNFEQLASTSSIAGPAYRQWLRPRIVVDYHSANVEFLQRENGPGQRAFELPIMPVPSIIFQRELLPDKQVDVLFFGTMSERRAEIILRLQAAGLSVETVAGAYGDELTPAIRRARLVLHVHFYETGLFPVARVLQPLANALPVVCEDSVFSTRSDWSQSGVVFVEYDAIVQTCRAVLDSAAWQHDLLQRTRRFVRQADFATPFAEVVRALTARLEPPPSLLAAPITEPAAGGAVPPSSMQRTPADAAREADGPLSTEQIEAILEREATVLPPESHVDPPPVAVVENRPGQGMSRWVSWLLFLFSLLMAWQSLR
jgi:hypothetical protein